MRTTVVVDAKFVAAAMKRGGATSLCGAIEIALRQYLSERDYGALLALLALGGSGTVADDYDPKGTAR